MSRRTAPDPWDIARIEAEAPDEASVVAARKLLNTKAFGTVERRADGSGWWANCKGMTGTYSVTVSRDESGGVRAKCTCPSYKDPCKHALALLIYLAENPSARPESRTDLNPPSVARQSAFEPLLRAAFATPADDTPRLVFADFLEEAGQPDRAALIRIQCATADLQPRSARRKPLAAEEDRLLDVIRPMFGAVPRPFKLTFDRGFVTLSSHERKPLHDPGAYPNRFLSLFRDGWVEAYVARNSFANISRDAMPYFHMVGTVDLTNAFLDWDVLDQIARKLEPGRPDSRLAFVRMHPSDARHVANYRAERAKVAAARAAKKKRLSGGAG